MARKQRLDVLLVERGLIATRAKAQAAIMAGQVQVDGRAQTKAGTLAAADARIEIAAPSPYVSRGGLKLEAALKAFPVKVAGRVCLDLGASTGGFTDCLLQNGAAKVYAIDVGRGQLDAKLRGDPRVVSREQTHAKEMRASHFDPAPTLGVVDVAFISLTQVLAPLAACLQRPFELLALVKPQFEVGPKLAPKGVVKDPASRLLAIDRVRETVGKLGLAEKGLLECPVHGPKGNVEFFLYLSS